MVTQGGGHVVNITTSLVDHADSKRPSALASLTKGGLAAVTRALAIEYASRGVRVNAVAPGVIKTPVHDPASYEGMAGLHPIGRLGEISDIVDGDPLSRTRHLRHRRDPAHRRRLGRRTLTRRTITVTWSTVGACGSPSGCSVRHQLLAAVDVVGSRRSVPCWS